MSSEAKEITSLDDVIATEPPAKQMAVKISEMLNARTRHLTGVLLTQAESIIDPGPRLDAYKTLLRRELYNTAKEEVGFTHSIVSRATVTDFRMHPSLDEQRLQPDTDTMYFDEEEIR